MSSSPKVLVSILNYNNIKDTIETIECLKQQTYPNFDIIVIDNASTNDCVSKIKERFPDLKIICLDKNLGYTGGNNIAIEIGAKEGYDYVVLSNQDIAVEADLLSNLIETAQSKPLAGVIGVIEEDYYTGQIRAIGGAGFSFLRAKQNWIPTVLQGNCGVIDADYVQGAFVLFTRAAILAGIRFDNNLFLYCDEIELGFQLKKKGLKAFVDTHCRVRHKGIQEKFNLRQGYFMQRNRLYLSRKYAPRLVFPFTVLYMALVELPLKALIRSIQGHTYYARVCVFGFMDGLRGRMSAGRGFSL